MFDSKIQSIFISLNIDILTTKQVEISVKVAEALNKDIDEKYIGGRYITTRLVGFFKECMEKCIEFIYWLENRGGGGGYILTMVI